MPGCRATTDAWSNLPGAISLNKRTLSPIAHYQLSKALWIGIGIHELVYRPCWDSNFCRSCVGNHIFYELTRAMALPCPEIAIFQLSSPISDSYSLYNHSTTTCCQPWGRGLVLVSYLGISVQRQLLIYLLNSNSLSL